MPDHYGLFEQQGKCKEIPKYCFTMNKCLVGLVLLLIMIRHVKWSLHFYSTDEAVFQLIEMQINWDLDQ